jgi:hypothetical protein
LKVTDFFNNSSKSGAKAPNFEEFLSKREVTAMRVTGTTVVLMALVSSSTLTAVHFSNLKSLNPSSKTKLVDKLKLCRTISKDSSLKVWGFCYRFASFYQICIL